MPVSTHHPFSWRTALLAPPADYCFNDGFYPARKRGTKSRQVWYSIVEVTKNNTKVILASAPDKGNFRVITAELASTFLIDFGKATGLDSSSLNALAEHVPV